MSASPYAWMNDYTPVPDQVEDGPWLEWLSSSPHEAVDALLRGEAHLPGFERASPCEALMGLMGDLPDESPEWAALDGALLTWLQERRQADDALIESHVGIRHFIAEVGEGLRAAWRLKLPQTSSWIRAQLFDLLRWAEAISVDSTYDLARSVLAAGAHLQRGDEWRFLWLRICRESTTPSASQRRDVAMMGLARQPDKRTGSAPSQDILVGLASWASNLPRDERCKNVVVSEWRALKAMFPRQPTFWRGRLEALREDARFGDHPFLNWLRDAEPAMKAAKANGTNKRKPFLPPKTSKQVDDLGDDIAKARGLPQPLWIRITTLLDQLEHYADLTGESYYLVTSCTRIGKFIRPYAPGNALALARRALLWAPSDAHAWSLRAGTLETLGRPDLAKAVLWEGKRRTPSDPTFSNQLARLLHDDFDAAEHLLARADIIAPDSRLHYTQILLAVAKANAAEARTLAQGYGARHGTDEYFQTAERLIASGVTGQEEALSRLRGDERHEKEGTARVRWDATARDAALTAEEKEAPRLNRIGLLSEADILFALGDDARHRATAAVDQAIQADRYDSYAHLVKALGDGEYRQALRGEIGRFAGSLPVRLAALPDDAPVADWNHLAARFPENRALIDLIRLERGLADDGDRRRLDAWTQEPNRWDHGWEKFLKEQIAAHLRDEETAPLSLLAHDALIQAVDVGWDANPAAAA